MALSGGIAQRSEDFSFDARDPQGGRSFRGQAQSVQKMAAGSFSSPSKQKFFRTGRGLDRVQAAGRSLFSVDSGRSSQVTEKFGLVEKTMVGLIRFYQAVRKSVLIPWTCRFQPSCSAYAIEAISRHGAAFGSRLTLGRLFRCHPGNPGGWDPVPDSHPAR